MTDKDNAETKEDLKSNIKDLEGELTAAAMDLEAIEEDVREKDIQVRIENMTSKEIEEMNAKRKLLDTELRLARSKARLARHETCRIKSLQAEKDWAKNNRAEVIASFKPEELHTLLDKINSNGLGSLTEIERLEWLGARCSYSIVPPVEGRERPPRSLKRKYRLANQHRGKKRLSSFRGCLPLARRDPNGGVMYPKSGMTRRQIELALDKGTIPLISKAGTLTAEDFKKGKSELPVLLKSATREQISKRLLVIEEEERKELISGIDETIASLEILKAEVESGK